MCAVIAPPDFKRERGGKTATMLEVRKMRMIHPYWDMALLKVKCLDPAIGTLNLLTEDARSLAGCEIAVVATTDWGVPTVGSR